MMLTNASLPKFARTEERQPSMKVRYPLQTDLFQSSNVNIPNYSADSSARYSNCHEGVLPYLTGPIPAITPRIEKAHVNAIPIFDELFSSRGVLPASLPTQSYKTIQPSLLSTRKHGNGFATERIIHSNALQPGEDYVGLSRQYKWKPREICLGSGFTSTVHLGTDMWTQQAVAVKVVPKNKQQILASESYYRKIYERLPHYRHPNLLSIHDFFEDKQNFYVISELCKGPDLVDFVLGFSPGCIPIEITQRLIIQILLGLNQLHEAKLLHRDIKLDNILFLDQEKQRINIIDFDMCLLQDAIHPPKKLGNSEGISVVGTKDYMAPECYKGRYSTAADLWSDTSTTRDVLIMLERGMRISNKLKRRFPLAIDLLERLTVFNPSKRYASTQMALSHPWFNRIHKSLSGVLLFATNDQNKKFSEYKFANNNNKKDQIDGGDTSNTHHASIKGGVVYPNSEHHQTLNNSSETTSPIEEPDQQHRAKGQQQLPGSHSEGRDQQVGSALSLPQGFSEGLTEQRAPDYVSIPVLSQQLGRHANDDRHTITEISDMTLVEQCDYGGYQDPKCATHDASVGRIEQIGPVVMRAGIARKFEEIGNQPTVASESTEPGTDHGFDALSTIGSSDQYRRHMSALNQSICSSHFVYGGKNKSVSQSIKEPQESNSQTYSVDSRCQTPSTVPPSTKGKLIESIKGKALKRPLTAPFSPRTFLMTPPQRHRPLTSFTPAIWRSTPRLEQHRNFPHLTRTSSSTLPTVKEREASSLKQDTKAHDVSLLPFFQSAIKNQSKEPSNRSSLLPISDCTERILPQFPIPVNSSDWSPAAKGKHVLMRTKDDKTGSRTCRAPVDSTYREETGSVGRGSCFKERHEMPNSRLTQQNCRLACSLYDAASSVKLQECALKKSAPSNTRQATFKASIPKMSLQTNGSHHSSSNKNGLLLFGGHHR